MPQHAPFPRFGIFHVFFFLFVLVFLASKKSSGLFADSLGDLVLVKAVLGLELLDESDVALLGLLGGDALVDNLLPGTLLGLALYSKESLV